MMEFREPLYLGAKVQANAGAIIRDAAEGRFAKGLYLLTLASNGRDQLNLVNTAHLIGKEAAIRHMPLVVGLAIGRDEAIRLVAKLARWSLKETGRVDLPAYLAQAKEIAAEEEDPWAE